MAISAANMISVCPMSTIGEPLGKVEAIIVPDPLLQELAALRVSYALLLRRYKKELQNSPEAQENFVEMVPTVFSDLYSEMTELIIRLDKRKGKIAIA